MDAEVGKNPIKLIWLICIHKLQIGLHLQQENIENLDENITPNIIVKG